MIRAYRLDVLIIHCEVDTAPPAPWEREKIGEPDVTNKLAFILVSFENESPALGKGGSTTTK